MPKENVIRIKSYDFALRIVKLYKYLIEEVVSGLSRADFIARMGIAYKEARETHFWLRLLRDSG